MSIAGFLGQLKKLKLVCLVGFECYWNRNKKLKAFLVKQFSKYFGNFLKHATKLVLMATKYFYDKTISSEFDQASHFIFTEL